MLGIGARIAAFFTGAWGYVVAAGAVLLALAGIVAKISSDGKARGRAEVRDAARKQQDQAVEKRHEIDNRINAGGGNAARQRLRDDWQRDN